MGDINFWTEDVVTVSGDETVTVAAKLMNEKKISSLVIVDDEAPVGIITERDLVTLIAEGLNPSKTKVFEVMTPNPLTVSITADFYSVRRKMLENDFRHMPVIDTDGKLVGIVSLKDLIGDHVQYWTFV